MYKFLSCLSFILFATHANATPCPTDYRFVDFGLEGRDGILRRGGTIFRAFTPDGTRLLIRDRSVCREVEEMSVDGRALPIPVVSRIAVDTDIAALEVADLQIMVLQDTITSAEANAAEHRTRLAQTGATITRSQDFLCVSGTETGALSCQVVSPYENNAALVIYCDAQECEMPILVRDDQLGISAKWRPSKTDPDALGHDISDRIQRIHDFLEEQI
jgi:hypothetical protein